MTVSQPLHTGRLRLLPLGAEALAAWIDRDAERLGRATGAVFPEPPEAPPLFDDDLPGFLERMEEAPEDLGWWVWLVARTEDDAVVGVCGLGGRPGADGSVVIGYSVYPAFEGRGYASEAARALVGALLSRPGVRRVRATVPVGHDRSAGVALSAGLVQIGRDEDPEVGEVLVFETR